MLKSVTETNTENETIENHVSSSLGVVSVRLNSTRGEQKCQCVNDPVAGISSPRLPQDVSGSATDTAKRTARSGELKEEQIF